MRRHAGITLVEIIVVLLIVSMTVLAITSVTMQASKLYATTSWHIEPQASATIALKRMQSEMRDAMLVSTSTPSPTTWLEVTLPLKDDNGMNITQADANGHFYLLTGQTVAFFLGKKISPVPGAVGHWVAQPSYYGTTLFRATSDYNEVSNIYPDSQVIIDDIVNPAQIANDPQLSQELAKEALRKTLFVYVPYDDNGTPNDPTDDKPTADTQLVNITLIVQSSYQGKPVYHPLSTQFCLRNLKH